VNYYGGYPSQGGSGYSGAFRIPFYINPQIGPLELERGGFGGGWGGGYPGIQPLPYEYRRPPSIYEERQFMPPAPQFSEFDVNFRRRGLLGLRGSNLNIAYRQGYPSQWGSGYWANGHFHNQFGQPVWGTGNYGGGGYGGGFGGYPVTYGGGGYPSQWGSGY
jgi:hypothetical protein